VSWTKKFKTFKLAINSSRRISQKLQRDRIRRIWKFSRKLRKAPSAKLILTFNHRINLLILIFHLRLQSLEKNWMLRF